MRVAAWMAGTKFFVSSFSQRPRDSAQKSLVPMARMASVTVRSPALYAAWARFHEPKTEYRSTK